ncbi:MAG: hypothetical protein KF906_11635 [Actinobacteria bacterium]|nr:hypothetical protein [Actinomycetota bacterium]
MNWAALVVFGTLGVIVTAACLAFLMVRHRFHRRHRVDLAIPTDAPVTWLADPRVPARLHRRLVRIGAATTAVADDHRPRPRRLRRAEEADAIHEAAVALRARAVAADNRLARLAILTPASRRDGLRVLDQEVAQLERACAQLLDLDETTTRPVSLPTDVDTAVDPVTRRIDHLADAHRELQQLDDTAGLVPDPTLRTD